MEEKDFKLQFKKNDFTLISRDCIGGILYHQLGLKFLTPTINLFFTPEDFNCFCLNLKDYIDTELKEYVDEKTGYPVGVLSPDNLKPINVCFMHYTSFKKAKEKWDDRKTRINWDNIFVVSSFCYPIETSTLSQKLIDDWNKIKYKKILLVDKRYGFDNEFVVEKNSECKDYAWLLYSPDKRNPWRRTFNDFDFIKYLNDK